MNVLLIDNYDSFVFNLYQYIGEILQSDGHGSSKVVVRRNDAITLDEIAAIQPDRIVISPGPGSADDPAYFGVCAEVIRTFAPSVPMLGVCLGMQGMVHVFGGKIIRDDPPIHGKTSPILHDGQGVFYGLPQGISVMRYHSLRAAQPLPDCLAVTAVVGQHSDDFVQLIQQHHQPIMGIRHREYPLEGVQFHPESFATEGAKIMIANFLHQKS